MYIITIFSLIALISNSIFIDCEPGELCVVDANASMTIFANCNVTDLIVNCYGENGCKPDGGQPGLTVYSSAYHSEVNCFGEASCEGLEFYFGISPLDELVNEFDCDRSTVTMNCLGKQSCKKSVIKNEGNVFNGLRIITPTDTTENVGAFMQGCAFCGTDTSCLLECGTHVDTCKDSKCLGNCQCMGSACPGNYNSIPTPEPTIQPTNETNGNAIDNGGNSVVGGTTASPIPTLQPTPEPTEFRNETVCEETGCILKPYANYDVICPHGIPLCTIECSESAQCSEDVIIIADSTDVQLVCREIDSCKGLQIYNTKPSTITITIFESKGGESMFIDIANPDTTLSVNVIEVDGFAKGTIICDGNCNLNCWRQNSCKDVIYECLTDFNQCKINCNPTVGNSCPIVSNFGTPTCTTPVCTVRGGGDTRLIALNDVTLLKVICNEFEGQCKKTGEGLRVYSAADKTELHCDVKDGCEDAQIFVGPLKGKYVPKGFDESEFARSKPSILVTKCDDESACTGITIYTTGNIESTITGNGEESLAESTTICDNCNSLNVNCQEFGGCINSNILCTNQTACNCDDAYIIELDNVTALTTQSPKNSCPMITEYVEANELIDSNTIHNVKDNNKSPYISFGGIVPLTVSCGIFIFCIYAAYQRRRKRNASVDGKQSSDLLRNDNIYSTYQE